MTQKHGQEALAVAGNSLGLLKKVVIHVAGISLIILGIIGLVLPVLQGILMIIAGLSLLSIGNEHVRIWLEGLAKRYPRQARFLRRIKAKISLFGRTSGQSKELD